MPSASRPFSPEVVARLVARGITFAPGSRRWRVTRTPTPSPTTSLRPRPGWST
jgi:hypothetical protein